LSTAILVTLAVATAVAAEVYVMSSHLAPVYRSSADVRVSVPQTTALTNLTISAANDLAAQYAQLAGSAPVVVGAEARLFGADQLLAPGDISASTVASQNLIRITAAGDTPGRAQRRADAAAKAFLDYVNSLNSSQITRYATIVSKTLRPTNVQIADTQRAVHTTRGSARKDQQLLLTGMQLQRQQTRLTLDQTTLDQRPLVAEVSAAVPGHKVSPRPLLYAAVAFAVLLIGLGRLLVTPLWRRRQRRAGVFAPRRLTSPPTPAPG
jgi:hypothetical protein